MAVPDNKCLWTFENEGAGVWTPVCHCKDGFNPGQGPEAKLPPLNTVDFREFATLQGVTVSNNLVNGQTVQLNCVPNGPQNPPPVPTS